MGTRFKGGISSEQLAITDIKDRDMIQCRHDVGGSGDSDKGIAYGLMQALPVGTCTTSGSTVAKVANIDTSASHSDFVLFNGRTITILFTNKNTATSPTLNVNGTGALPIKVVNQASGVNVASGCWGSNAWIQFQYVENGQNSYWLMVGNEIAESHTNNMKFSNGHQLFNGIPYAVCSDSATTVERTATIQNYTTYPIVVGAEVQVHFNNAYTPATNAQLTLTIGGVTAPCTAKGKAMKQGSVYAGMEVRAFYNGTSWDLDTDIVEHVATANSGYTIYADGRIKRNPITQVYEAGSYTILNIDDYDFISLKYSWDRSYNSYGNVVRIPVSVFRNNNSMTSYDIAHTDYYVTISSQNNGFAVFASRAGCYAIVTLE